VQRSQSVRLTDRCLVSARYFRQTSLRIATQFGIYSRKQLTPRCRGRGASRRSLRETILVAALAPRWAIRGSPVWQQLRTALSNNYDLLMNAVSCCHNSLWKNVNCSTRPLRTMFGIFGKARDTELDRLATHGRFRLTDRAPTDRAPTDRALKR